MIMNIQCELNISGENTVPRKLESCCMHDFVTVISIIVHAENSITCSWNDLQVSQKVIDSGDGRQSRYDFLSVIVVNLCGRFYISTGTHMYSIMYSPVSSGMGHGSSGGHTPPIGVSSHPGQLSLAIPLGVGAMSNGDGFGHRQGSNSEFCVTVGLVTQTTGILI